MTMSIIYLLLLGVAAAGMGAIFSNLMRVSEMRELEKQLQKYEKAFALSIRANRKTLEEMKSLTKKIEERNFEPFPEARIEVIDDAFDLPKFGDE